MKYELCVACDNSDPVDTNERQQIRCTKIESYVDRFNGCDDFENKALDECFKNIGKSELTDNKIIRALECCTNTHLYTCDDCPFYQNCQGDEDVLRYALDLINRKQAEIERLKEQKTLIANIEVSEDMFKKLINQKVCFVTNNEADVSFSCDEHIRADAIKEFAERLKANEREHCQWCNHSNKGRRSDWCDELIDGHCRCLGFSKFESKLDNLVKEMAGAPQ